MKTTIDLPDDLLIAAKKRAAELRTPLSALIEAGLRSQLQDRKRERSKKRKINWITVNGGLPSDLDISGRESMHNWLGQNK